MDWVPYIIAVAVVGAVPGLILGPRRLTLGIGGAIVALYALGMIRMWVWAIDCWDCRYEMGFTEKVYQKRADAFAEGFEFFGAFVGLLLVGLLLGTAIRQYANSRFRTN